MTFQGRHFPGDYRDDLYVFGIRGARRMGSDGELIQNLTFFVPPKYIYPLQLAAALFKIYD